MAYNLEKELEMTLEEEQPKLKLKWKTAEIVKKFKKDKKKDNKKENNKKEELTKEQKINEVNKYKEIMSLQ